MESKKNKIARLNNIISILRDIYPEAHIELVYKNPLELLVSTILSAQCTDERVNIVTKKLFKKYKIPEDYLNVEAGELEQDIFSTGFYKAKAKNIRGAMRKLLDDFNAVIPNNMNDLLSLPGVGHKTANVILGHCFEAEGIVVDTHVIRLSNRMGFVKSKNAEIIERELMNIVNPNDWTIFTHYFINHGRKICTARKAMCSECKISEYCKKVNVT